MEKSVKITGIIAVTLVILALIGIFSVGSMSSSQTVSTQGQASLKVIPNLVTVFFNVETNGSDAKTAKDTNAEIVDKMITEMIKLGFERSEIQTENFYIGEDMVWENNRYVNKGYKASHQIKVVLNTTEAALIADVIDAGVDSGALLSYINFELSTDKQNEYKAMALKQAGEDAKTKASAIAEGLGKRIGSLISVSSSDFAYQPWNIYSARSDVSAGMNAQEAKISTTNIVAGSQEVSAQITVVYKIK